MASDYLRRAFSTRPMANAEEGAHEILLQRRARSQALLASEYKHAALSGVGFGGTAFFGAPPVVPIASQQSFTLWVHGLKEMTGSRTTNLSDGIDGMDEPAADAAADDEAARAYAWNSKALPALHFVIGVLNNLQIVAWRQFLIRDAISGKGLNPAEQTFLGSVVSALPWNLKIFVAFSSDVLPICGYRRLSYLTLGLGLQGGGWLALGLLGSSASLPMMAAQQFAVTMGQMAVGVMCDALIVENVSFEKGKAVGYLQTTCQIFFALGGLVGTALSGALPQYAHLANELMFAIRGVAALGVILPALLTLRESPRARPANAPARRSSGSGSGSGGLGATASSVGGSRAAGESVASLGASMSSATGGGACRPPHEPRSQRRRCCANVAATVGDIWETTKQLRVFCPLVFIFVFAAVPASSDAFNTYLLQQTPLCSWRNASGASGACLDATDVADATIANSSSSSSSSPSSGIDDWCAGFGASSPCERQFGGLGFSDMLYSTFGLLGSAGSVFGNFLFRRYMLTMNWHAMFAATVLLAWVGSSLQLVLMFRDAADGRTLSERLHLPDAAFALGDDVIVATANQLLAMPILVLMARLCPPGAEGTTYALVTSVQTVGGTVGGVISTRLTAAFGVTNTDFSRLWQLTLLTSTAKLIALPFLPLVPSAATLDTPDERRSVVAGAVIFLLFAGGLAWALTQVGLTLA